MARRGDKPDYIATAKVNGDKNRWTTVGGAWHCVNKDGVYYIAVRLQSVPLGWDGNIMLHKNNEEPEAPQAE